MVTTSAMIDAGTPSGSAAVRDANTTLASTFGQVAGMVAHVGNVQQAHQAARVQAAQQEIARAQTQGQSQGQAVGR